MMEWDAYIEKESEFVVLPEGDYDFIVTSFEKGWFDGSAKVEACNKAMLELTIKAPGLGTSIVKEQLLLSDKVEWKLCEFFRCIGQKQHGTGVKMDWNKVPNARGRAHIVVNEYVGNDGNQYKNNKVARYLDPETELGGEQEW